MISGVDIDDSTKWNRPGWRIEQKYSTDVLIGNWNEERRVVGIATFCLCFAFQRRNRLSCCGFGTNYSTFKTGLRTDRLHSSWLATAINAFDANVHLMI